MFQTKQSIVTMKEMGSFRISQSDFGQDLKIDTAADLDDEESSYVNPNTGCIELLPYKGVAYRHILDLLSRVRAILLDGGKSLTKESARQISTIIKIIRKIQSQLVQDPSFNDITIEYSDWRQLWDSVVICWVRHDRFFGDTSSHGSPINIRLFINCPIDYSIYLMTSIQ